MRPAACGGPLNAVRLPLGRPIAPFGDAPADAWVLGRSLADVQARALLDAGVTLGSPRDEPHLEFADHLWFTGPLVKRFLATCPATGGQLRIDGPFLDATAALQDLPDGRLPMWLVPSGRSREDLPPITVDLGVDARPVPSQHPALDQADARPIPVTDAMAHTIAHWVHLHRVNLLALLALFEGERRRLAASWWRGLYAVVRILLRARSLRPHRLAAAIGERGTGAKIHPTAVIEASILGDDVEVGSFAVVRGCWVGDGAKISEQCRVAGSIIGERATVARGANVQLSVLLPGAWVSEGQGHQMCVFGRGSFVAQGVTTFDLSFGSEIEVAIGGARRSAGTRFLGSAIGHRARIGPHVRIGYGEAIPNDALLIGDPAAVARHVPDVLNAGPHVVNEGRLAPFRPERT